MARLDRRYVRTDVELSVEPFDACYLCPHVNAPQPDGERSCRVLRSYVSPCWVLKMRAARAVREDGNG